MTLYQYILSVLYHINVIVVLKYMLNGVILLAC